MHNINYCVGEDRAGDQLSFCVVQSIVGYLPSISLLVFAASIYSELLRKEVPARFPATTIRYSIKFVMMFLSLVCSVANLLINIFFLSQITLLPTLISLFWTLNWVLVLMISRDEYIRSSKSSTSFKIFILLFLLCHIANFVLTLHYAKLEHLFQTMEEIPMILLGLNTLLLTCLNICTGLFDEDRTPMQPIDYLLMDGNHEDVNMAKGDKNDLERRSTRVCSNSLIFNNETPVKASPSGRSSISNTSRSSGSNGKQLKIPFDADVTKDETLQEYLKFREKTKKADPQDEVFKKAEKSKSTEDLRKLGSLPMDGAVENISVVDFEEGFNKKILYTIKYTIGGREVKTKKRFSQMRSMYKMLKRKFVNEEFPLFPPKVSFKFIEKSKLIERRELLDGLMKYLLANHSSEPIFINFLEMKCDTGSDSTVNSTDSKESKESKESNESKEDKEKPAEPAPSKLKTREGTTKEIENKITQQTIQSSTTTIVKNNGSLIDTRKQRFSLTDNLIKNYTDITQDVTDQDSSLLEKSSNKRSSISSSSCGRHYKVTIEGTLDKASEKGDRKKIFYNIQIIDSSSGEVLSNISRRYSEFKSLHKSLKSTNNRRKSQEIPELPFKGKVGIFVSRNDPKVIEYRKFALKSYLQALINDQFLQNNVELLKFLEIVVL